MAVVRLVDGGKSRVTADAIAGCLARNTFANALCVVDRCNYLPAECDLLVIAPCLRYIDVEIKVSRADLKADRGKNKWWDSPPVWRKPGEPRPPDIKREWPRSVWKHYYALPASLWKSELVAVVHPTSGVLLVHADDREPRWWRVEAVKRAKPCVGAKQATA
jgi:hypothetical protein